MKHTKGPWSVDKRVKTLVLAGSLRTICTTGGYTSTVKDFTAENEANAVLAASAPQLLRELKSLIAEIEFWHPNDNGWAEDALEEHAAIARCRALIKKLEKEA